MRQRERHLVPLFYTVPPKPRSRKPPRPTTPCPPRRSAAALSPHSWLRSKQDSRRLALPDACIKKTRKHNALMVAPTGIVSASFDKLRMTRVLATPAYYRIVLSRTGLRVFGSRLVPSHR